MLAQGSLFFGGGGGGGCGGVADYSVSTPSPEHPKPGLGFRVLGFGFWVLGFERARTPKRREEERGAGFDPHHYRSADPCPGFEVSWGVAVAW